MAMERDQGFAAMQQGNMEEAVRLLEVAVQTDPADYQAFLYLGAAYGQAERHNEAVNALTQAVTLQPSNAQARYNLGIALDRAGWQDQAATAFEQALTLQPDYPKAQEALARLRGTSLPGMPPATMPDATQYAAPPAQSYPAPEAAQYAPVPPTYAPPAQPTQYAPPPPAYGQPPAQMYAQQPGAPLAYGQPQMYPGYAGSVAFQNTSGMKSEVPPEIARFKWNWGACLWSWIWLCGHNMVAAGIGLLIASSVLNVALTASKAPVFIGLIIGFCIQIFLGINGHKIAWRNRRFDSVEQFIAVERKWALYGIIPLAFIALVIISVFFQAINGGQPISPPIN